MFIANPNGNAASSEESWKVTAAQQFSSSSLPSMITRSESSGGDVPKRLEAPTPAVGVVDLLPREVADVDITVAAAHVCVHAHRECVGERQVDANACAKETEIAGHAFKPGAGFEIRARGDDANRAGRGVFAVERALRAAQDFDPLDVGEVADRRAGAGAINAVNENADRGFEARIVRAGADAADGGRGAGGLRLAGANAQVRRHLAQIGQRVDAGVL
jgi:hypothetical protein